MWHPRCSSRRRSAIGWCSSGWVGTPTTGRITRSLTSCRMWRPPASFSAAGWPSCSCPAGASSPPSPSAGWSSSTGSAGKMRSATISMRTRPARRWRMGGTAAGRGSSGMSRQSPGCWAGISYPTGSSTAPSPNTITTMPSTPPGILSAMSTTSTATGCWSI